MELNFENGKNNRKKNEINEVKTKRIDCVIDELERLGIIFDTCFFQHDFSS